MVLVFRGESIESGLWRGMLDFIDAIIDGFIDLVFTPLVTESLYRRGFITALILGFFIGKISRAILYARALILQFFGPSTSPATKSGPSSYDRMRGCSSGFIRLIFISIFLIILIVAIFFSFSR